MLNLTDTNRSSVTGTNCFPIEPIPFTMRQALEVHIPYLLLDCVANFVFQTEVSGLFVMPPQERELSLCVHSFFKNRFPMI